MPDNMETAQEAALRFGVTVRAIQKWAAAGRIPGAQKLGRSWFIPRTAVILDEAPEKKEESKIPNSVPDVYQLEPFREAMPLMNARFPVGRCMDYIRSIPDEHDRNIALGEYYFFSGQAEESTKILEPYLDSHDPALRYSAALLCTFANLARGHIHLARFAMGVLQTQVRAGLATDSPPKLHALGIFTATTASVLIHLPVPDLPPLEDYLRYLPGGIKLWACYVLAHKAYLEKDYSRSLAIADMSIALGSHDYPIAMVYLNLVSVMALMSLKRPEEALQRMDAAWKVAKPDNLIQPFGEHHGLLQGTIEIYFRKNAPEMLKPILDITYAFSATWRKFHNPDTNHEVADNLTTTEFTIAMLYNRDWSAKEIAAHMDMKERSIRTYIKNIYVKLGITNKDELGKYMLA